MPIDTDTKHPQALVFHEKLGNIEVDEELSELLVFLWSIGCKTLYSCQGNDEPKYYGTQDHAYILFSHTNKSWDITHMVLVGFPLLFTQHDNINFSFSFDNQPDMGPRILWRFPKKYISTLHSFLEDNS